MTAPSRDARSADRMLFTFVGFLRTRLGLLRGTIPANDDAAASLDDIRTRLEALHASPGLTDWDEAYRIERDLILLHRGEALHQCLKELLDEADAQLVPTRSRLRAMYADALTRIYDGKTPPALAQGSDDILRQVANTVLEAIQWEARSKYLAIPQRQVATHRILWAGLVSFALFIFPFALAACSFLLKKYDPTWTAGDLVLHWRGIVLWTVLTAGLLGAYFSRLQYMQAGVDALSLEELENAKSWRSILLRGAVGMVGALLVFYVLTSKLIDGTLVPQAGAALTLLGGKDAPVMVVPNKDLALLAVWCLLAGFSERLVPNILSAAEGQFSAASSKKDGKGG